MIRHFWVILVVPQRVPRIQAEFEIPLHVHQPKKITEPVGSSPPKFPSEDKVNTVQRGVESALSLSCPAQASPRPSHRLVCPLGYFITAFRLTFGLGLCPNNKIFRANWWIKTKVFN